MKSAISFLLAIIVIFNTSTMFVNAKVPEFEWVEQAGGAGTNFRSDAGKAITVDSSGNIIVTGFFSGTATFGGTTLTTDDSNIDLFIAKYDSESNLLWIKQGITESYYTEVTSGFGITTDEFDNIYKNT